MSGLFGNSLGLLGGIKIIESPLAYTYEPNRKHKKRRNQSAAYHRRVQKKWTKRFGTKKVPCAYVINTDWLRGSLGNPSMIAVPPGAMAMLKNLSA